MRNPMRKLAYGLLGLCLAVPLLWLGSSGRLAPEDSNLSLGLAMIGFTMLCVSGYFMPASLLAARGRARLLAGTDVIARWNVGAADWERFRSIDLAASGIRAPLLKGLHFTPRPAPATGVDVVAGTRSVLIDDCYFSLRPSKSDGMESAQWARTTPTCIALIIRPYTQGATHRWLLLLPVPRAAMDAAGLALRHYQQGVARIG